MTILVIVRESIFIFGGCIMKKVFNLFSASGTQRDLAMVQDAGSLALNPGSGVCMNTQQGMASGKILAANYGNVLTERT
jgi:hypothetical protein